MYFSDKGIQGHSMNLLLILFLMILPTSDALAWPASASQKGSALTPGAATPEAAVKDFYRWYIDRLSKNKDPLMNEPLALKKYLTPEFFRKAPKLLEQTGADVFICAQDWDKDWGKNASISKLNIQGSVATLNVTLAGNLMNHKLKVILRRLDGAWKIDKIDPLDL
jgi:hypothetical protein